MRSKVGLQAGTASLTRSKLYTGGGRRAGIGTMLSLLTVDV